MVWNMKGNIEQLFRERFQGHETPVDPGMWEAIQQQMGATAPAAADGVNELFRERFAEHEVQMDASVWEGISKELGHAAPAAPGQGVMGWAAATAGVLVVAAGLWYLGTTDAAPKATPSLVINTEQINAPTTEQPEAEAAPMVAEARTTETAVQGSPEVRPTSTKEATTSKGPVTAPVRPADASGDATPMDLLPSIANSPATPPPTVLRTEPALVETIIQQITERTVNEVRANPEMGPPPTPETDSEGVGGDQPTPGEQEPLPELFIPNVFTPNGDIHNNEFQVIGVGFERIFVKVFALKNNQLVFSTHEGEAWTGANCEDGMYLVAVEAVTTDGRAVTKAKVVWLNRERMN